MKKKQANTPRAKRMNRQGRLQAAVSWLKKYDGNRYIRGYRKYFGVDVGTAIAELEILGVPLSAKAIQQARDGASALEKSKRDRKEKRKQLYQNEEQMVDIESDEIYAYIAGYTSGGFPFGITWEEMERLADQESLDATLPSDSTVGFNR